MGDKSQIKLELTLDGSYTLFVPSLDEHYHSINGAVQESKHVFIEAGFAKLQKKSLNVLEVGFGTGLNTYLTFCAAKDQDREVNYTTLELYPLKQDVIDQLNYSVNDPIEDQAVFKRIHTCEWNYEIQISNFFMIEKINADFSQLNLSFDKKFDLIYFDAFAPDKQPEMWSQEIFDFLFRYTNTEGILTTYCAKGIVRRMMVQAGYKVERIPGPPGKREMLRAVKVIL